MCIYYIYTYIHNRLYSTHINVFLFVTSSVYHGNGYITNNMIVTFSHRVWSSSNDDHFPKLIHQIAVETWVKWWTMRTKEEVSNKLKYHIGGPPFLIPIFFLDSQTDPHIIWVVMYPAIFLWMVGFSMISPLFWPYFSLWSTPKSIEDHLLRLCRDRLQGVTTRATKYHHVHKNGTWWHTKQRLDNIPNFAMPPLK